jgi:aminopeptidase-like protein
MVNALQQLERRDLAEVGRELHGFAAQLFPICRSITGDGLRKTLAMIRERIPLQIFEVGTGTPVFDWTVPKEWNIRDAHIRVPGGKLVVDFQQNNLHVLNYSKPAQATMSLSELKPHLFTLPDHPDWIPYRISTIRETGVSAFRTSICRRLRIETTKSVSTLRSKMVI